MWEERCPHNIDAANRIAFNESRTIETETMKAWSVNEVFETYLTLFQKIDWMMWSKFSRSIQSNDLPDDSWQSKSFQLVTPPKRNFVGLRLVPIELDEDVCLSRSPLSNGTQTQISNGIMADVTFKCAIEFSAMTIASFDCPCHVKYAHRNCHSFAGKRKIFIVGHSPTEIRYFNGQYFKFSFAIHLVRTKNKQNVWTCDLLLSLTWWCYCCHCIAIDDRNNEKIVAWELFSQTKRIIFASWSTGTQNFTANHIIASPFIHYYGNYYNTHNQFIYLCFEWHK